MTDTGSWDRNPMGYTTVEMLLDDVSKQMASSNLSRYSRGSNGQRTGSTRITKPSSSNNSPGGSSGLGRRRTVMSDGAYRRRLAMLEHHTAMSAAGFVSNNGLQVPSVAPRPVSWHPTSHFGPSQPYNAGYQAPSYGVSSQYQTFDAPISQAFYSGHASPDSTFSPLSMPFTGYEQPQYQYQDPSTTLGSSYQTDFGQHQQQFQEQTFREAAHVPQSIGNTDPTMYSHFDWNNFATNGFENSSTAPPTPDNFLPIQHPEPTFPAEESIPYHPLSNPESEGEELIGMGLYDAPEVVKTPSSNPQLEHYRALMMSQYLGAGHRTVEATGKGLKLEETWQPPPSDDGEDDEDSEQDGEAEDEDEPIVVQPNAALPSHERERPIELSNYSIPQTQMGLSTNGYGGPGWL